MKDSKIIELYWQREPDAIAETDRKYGSYCFTNFAGSVRGDFYAVARITRSIAFNRWSAQNAKKRGGGEIVLVLDELSECIAGKNDVESEIEEKELSECVRLFVRALPVRDGNVFVRRYFFNETIAEIAEKYGLSRDNVTVILSRTRKKLKTHLQREGYVSEKQ